MNSVQYPKNHRVHHRPFDPDHDHSILTRSHTEAVSVALLTRRRLDAVLGAWDETDLVIAEGCAASSDYFVEYLSEIDPTAVLKTWGARLRLVSSVTHEPDTVDQVQR